MIYQGAQTPLGVATFDGTLAELARRLEHPPLSQWAPSFYGMVEGGTLKIADNGSDTDPLHAEVKGLRDPQRYTLECRLQCYAGPTNRASVIVRYVDKDNLARFWIQDGERTYYQERLQGEFRTPVALGANRAYDAGWHDWVVEVDGSRNRLVIDGQMVGECETTAWLLERQAGAPVQIGFSTLDTYVSIAYVRVR